MKSTITGGKSEYSAADSVRILYLNEFFWPDNAGRLIKSLSRAWAEAGHDVTVLTMQPHYRSYRGPKKVASSESIDGVFVKRMRAARLRIRPELGILINAVVFFFGVCIHALRRGRPGVIVTGTMPPIVCAFLGFGLARIARAKYVYHCQDIYPEAEEALQRSLGRSDGSRWRAAAFRFLKWLDSWVMRRADTVVVLSHDMARTVRMRGVPEDRIAVINNYFLAGEQTAKLPRPRTSSVKLLFAGNVGRFQRLDLLVEALGRLPAGASVELLILGDGSAKDELMELAARVCPSRVGFHDPVPMSEVGRFIDEADYCVVSLVAGLIEVAYPSKVMAYLGRSAPLLCIVEPDSELGRLVADAGFGVVVPPGDVDCLQRAILEIAAAPEQAVRRSVAAGRAGAELFSPCVIFGKWLKLFSRLDAGA